MANLGLYPLKKVLTKRRPKLFKAFGENHKIGPVNNEGECQEHPGKKNEHLGIDTKLTSI